MNVLKYVYQVFNDEILHEVHFTYIKRNKSLKGQYKLDKPLSNSLAGLRLISNLDPLNYNRFSIELRQERTTRT